MLHAVLVHWTQQELVQWSQGREVGKCRHGLRAVAALVIPANVGDEEGGLKASGVQSQCTTQQDTKHKRQRRLDKDVWRRKHEARAQDRPVVGMVTAMDPIQAWVMQRTVAQPESYVCTNTYYGKLHKERQGSEGPLQEVHVEFMTSHLCNRLTSKPRRGSIAKEVASDIVPY
eukprot:gnl/TRDRNA2_/TRDRNA2_140963_c0_seq1.p2 gnl/TRDRNA2_/TRDRNA2_140963_c0~~gnl/TRDRNA2_/TRDRNA2_140963_c0_seq1.p2  ORF type:complete len:173 (+),score=22.64 gnl/TRDRNA2_/TRDRNA2_140963_c0_seq1:157-675(+)